MVKDNNEICDDLTLGFLIENNIHSKEDFINYLNDREIFDEETRIKCLSEYGKWLEIQSKFAKLAKKFFVPLKPLIDIIDSISFPLAIFESLRPITIALETIKPIATIFRPIFSVIKEEINLEWLEKVEKRYKELKFFYLLKLIKSQRIFKENFFLFKNDKEKLLIIFSKQYLYMCSIFENFSIKLVKNFKNESELIKERIYRRTLKNDMKKLVDVLQINFYQFFNFLNNIVDNIKHNDKKFYKRYQNFTKEELLEEANSIYLNLKYYLKYSLINSYFLRIKLYHI